MYFRALVNQCEVTPSSDQLLSCFAFLVAECKSRSHIFVHFEFLHIGGFRAFNSIVLSYNQSGFIENISTLAQRSYIFRLPCATRIGLNYTRHIITRISPNSA